MGKEELVELNNGINDIWKFIKKFLPAADPDSDEYWTSLITEAGDLGRKHGNHPLINGMILVFADYVEKEAHR